MAEALDDRSGLIYEFINRLSWVFSLFYCLNAALESLRQRMVEASNDTPVAEALEATGDLTTPIITTDFFKSRH